MKKLIFWHEGSELRGIPWSMLGLRIIYFFVQWGGWMGGMVWQLKRTPELGRCVKAPGLFIL